MNRRRAIADSLAASVTRIDELLIPWGFTFEFDGVHGSHTGPYASGRYIRDTTHIGLSCRDTIDNIYYQHSFVKVDLCSRESEIFVIGHDTLMRALGHSDDCWLPDEFATAAPRELPTIVDSFSPAARISKYPPMLKVIISRQRTLSFLKKELMSSRCDLFLLTCYFGSVGFAEF
jgi:hypothetical protein